MREVVAAGHEELGIALRPGSDMGAVVQGGRLEAP